MKAKIKYSLILILVTFFVMSILGAKALATTSFEGGYSGLIRIPTAEIARFERAAIGYRRIGNNDKLVINYGLDGDIELGVTTSFWDGEKDSQLDLNAKIKILPETSRSPALAVGLVEEDVYLAISQSINFFGLRGHLGIGSGRFDNIFGGLAKTLNPVSILSEDSWLELPVTTLMAEYDGADFNMGANFKIHPQFDLNIMVYDLSKLGLGITLENKF